MLAVGLYYIGHTDVFVCYFSFVKGGMPTVYCTYFFITWAFPETSFDNIGGY